MPKFYFFSTKENKTITNNSFLDENEKIIIKIENNIVNENCKIKYSYIAVEPLYQDDNNYYVEKIGEDDETSYNSQKNSYTGRTIQYNIILEKQLEKDCQNINCNLCLYDDKDYCITCNYDYELLMLKRKFVMIIQKKFKLKVMAKKNIKRVI